MSLPTKVEYVSDPFAAILLTKALALPGRAVWNAPAVVGNVVFEKLNPVTYASPVAASTAMAVPWSYSSPPRKVE